MADDPLAQPVSDEVRREDAEVVAGSIFSDYQLSKTEVHRAALVLGPTSGGEEYRKVLTIARKAAKAPWMSIDPSKRQDCLWAAINHHLSGAEMERLALRTGACLLLAGQPELGTKILEETTAADWAPPKEDDGPLLWFMVLPMAVSLSQVALLLAQSVLPGYLALLPTVGVGIGAVAVIYYLHRRGQRRVDPTVREANAYALALERLAAGMSAEFVFRPDGTVRDGPG